jgi:hypothetical protein
MANYITDSQGNRVYYNQDSFDPNTQQNIENGGGDSGTDIPPSKNSSKSKKKTAPLVDPNTASNFSPNQATLEKSAYKMVSPDMGRYSYNERDLDDDYDFYGPLGSYDEIVDNRIARQSNFARGSNAILGGIAKGLGVALKDVGYMIDPMSYINLLNIPGMENSQSLSTVTDWLSDKFVSGVDNAMPIYEKESEGIIDQVFSWTTASGILESSVGFAIPGGMATKAGTWAAKGVSATGKLLNMASKANGLTRTERVARNLMRADEGFKLMLQSSPTAARIASVGGATFLQGVGEAMYESVDAHDAFLEKVGFSTLRGEKDIRDAYNLANQQAQRVYNLNIAKSALNLSMFDNMTSKFGKGMIDKPSILQKLKGAAPDVPLNMLEEASQDVFKKEAEYEALSTFEKTNRSSNIIKRLKESDQYIVDQFDKDFTLRVGELYGLNSTITAGIIGAISSPIQSGMTRGIGAKSRWKEQMKAYEDQQNFIKGANKIFESEEALKKEVEKVALTDRITTLSNKIDPDVLNPMVERMVYSQEIMNHLHKGTFEHLEKMAKEAQKEDTHMRNMYKYIQEIKPYIQKSEGKLNSSEITNAAFSLKQTQDLKDYYVEKRDKLLNKPESAKTNAEIAKIKEYNSVIHQYDKAIESMSSHLADLSSFSTQRKLAKSQVIENQLADVIKKVHSANTPAELNTLINEYPELKYSSTFKQREKIVSVIQQVAPSTVTTKPEVKSPIEKVTEVGTKPENAVENTDGVLETEDSEEAQATKEVLLTKAKEKGVDLQENDLVELEEIVNKKFDEIDVAIASGKTAKNPEQLYNDVMDEILDTYTSNREDLSKEKEQHELEEKILNKKEIASREGLDGKIPEEFLFDIVKDKVIAQTGRAELLNLESQVQTEDDAKAFESAKKKKEKELSKVSSQTAKNLKGLVKALMREKGDRPTKDDTADFKSMFQDFNSFVEYVRNAMNERFVSENYSALKDIYNTYYKGESLPETYSRFSNADPIVMYPEGMTSEYTDVIVEEIILESHSTNNNFEDVLEESFDNEGTSSNLDPTSSIAHLSVSYITTLDENGNKIQVDNSNPEISASPVLNPEKYNEGTPLIFEVQMNYKGRVSLKQNGDTVYFEDIKKYLINEKGDIRDVTDPVFIEFTKEYELEGVIPEDFIPVRIKGINDEHVGYMHTPNWMNKLRASEEVIAGHQAKMREKRSTVFEHFKSKKEGAVKGTVRHKVIKFENGLYKGFRISRKIGQKVKTSDQVQENTPIVILSVGDNLIGLPSGTKVLNKESVNLYPMGTPFILVPLNKGVDGKMVYHAEPLTHTFLNAGLKDSAKTLISAYLEPGKQESKKTIDFFKKRFNIDIVSPKGLRDMLSQFMYVIDNTEGTVESIAELGSTNGTIMVGINLETGVISFANYGSVQIDRKNMQNTSAAVEVLFSYIDSKIRFAINKKSITSKTPPKVAIRNAEGNWDIIEQPTYRDFVKTNTTTSLQPIPLPDGSNAYTIQNIVDFDISTEGPIKDVDKEESKGEIEQFFKEHGKASIIINHKKSNEVVMDTATLTEVGKIIEEAIIKKHSINHVIGKLNKLGVKPNDVKALEAFIKINSQSNTLPVVTFIENYSIIEEIDKKNRDKSSIGEREEEVKIESAIDLSKYFPGKSLSLSPLTTVEELIDEFQDKDFAYKLIEAVKHPNPKDEVETVVTRSMVYKSQPGNDVKTRDFYISLGNESKILAEALFYSTTSTIEEIEGLMEEVEGIRKSGLSNVDLEGLIKALALSETENRSQKPCN